MQNPGSHMNEERVPPPHPGAGSETELGRYRLVHTGDSLELRDRLFRDHAVGRFPPTAQGHAAAMAELGRLGDEAVSPWIQAPRRADRRPLTLTLSLVLGVVLAATFVPRLLPDGSRPLTDAEVLGRVERGTMLVLAYAGDTLFASGSGWIYDVEQGLVITNAHVVEGGSSFLVGRNGEGLAQASLLGAAPCYDLAVLRLSVPPGYEALELAPDDASKSERVASMGYPLGGEGAPDQGRPRSAFGSITDPHVFVANGPEIDLVAHSARLGSGDSGGPLVDMHGRLVGVNVGFGVQDPKVSFAIPVSDVREAVPELASGRSAC